jgi:hypothetical protein
MFPPESLYVLRKLLAETRVRPRWVVLDFMRYIPVFRKNEYSESAVAWHDWHYTLRTLRYVWSARMPGQETTRERVDASAYHLGLLAQRTLGAGRGHDWLELELKLVQPRKTSPPPDAGFEPLKPRPLPADEKAQFDEGIASLVATTKQFKMPLPYRQELEEIIALIRASGAVPVFVVAPDINGVQRFKNWPPADVAQFSYDYPETYPTLYVPVQRYDAEHLDAEGAKEFTRIFATEFADWLKRK